MLFYSGPGYAGLYASPKTLGGTTNTQMYPIDLKLGN